MRFINIPYEEFLKIRRDRKIIHFGASSAWKHYLNAFPDISSEVLDNTLFAVDNNPEKQGKQLEVANRRIPIEDAEKLKTEENYIILITVSLVYQKSICEQLLRLGLAENTECYSLPLMLYNFDETDNNCVKEYFDKHTVMVNTPKIHSFWFSGEEKPDLYKRCIDSWHRHCPDFEMIEWNAQNYDVAKNQYMKEAFEHKKWAFVSDYARLDVIYQYGGIYMDMDVELLAPITQLLCAESFFCRQEDGYVELGSGFGAKAGDLLVGEMLETYKNRKLILEDGKMDMTALPEWVSGVFKRHGIDKCHASQIIGDRLILSNDYITCYTGKNSTNNAKIGIHWHNGSWLGDKERKIIKDSHEVKDELVEKYFNCVG